MVLLIMVLLINSSSYLTTRPFAAERITFAVLARVRFVTEAGVAGALAVARANLCVIQRSVAVPVQSILVQAGHIKGVVEFAFT